MATTYFFADTNLFLHYKPLREVDWRLLGHFDDVEVVVCRTVQREIDELKGGREGRRSRRARRAASIFLKIVQHGPQQEKANSPRVLLSMYERSLPSKDLDDQLDYTKNDDCIIGFLAQFKAENPSADVRLLTGDSGPVHTAINLNLPYAITPNAWRLPPEPDERDRKIEQLTQQVKELQTQEPEFDFLCDQLLGPRSGHVEITYEAFQPLTSRERDQLLERLQNRYPPNVVSPTRVSTKVVSEYEDRDYPAWISECQKWMDYVHGIVQLEHCPELTVSIQNKGSRPATNALIEIRASKDLGLTAPMTELRECGLIPVMERPKPPDQPQPQASWPTMINDLTGLSSLALPELDFARHFRDQEDFEYAADVKLDIEPSVVLTCGLWRHSLEPKKFTVRLVPANFDSPITGEISCTVHADNLTKPATFKLIVTLSPDYRPILGPAFEWFTIPHPDE